VRSKTAVQYIDYFAVPRGPWAEVLTVRDLLLLLILCPGYFLRMKSCHQRRNGDGKKGAYLDLQCLVSRIAKAPSRSESLLSMEAPVPRLAIAMV
jgi:hypothetical protein